MVFHSLEFVIFFLVVYVLYLSLGHRSQNRMLLVASYAFYASWDWRFLSLIAVTTLTDFFCAQAIDASDDKIVRPKLQTKQIDTERWRKSGFMLCS